MKKVLASALAMAMAAGMTSMAFASTDAASIKVDDSSKLYMETEGVLHQIDEKDLMVKPGRTIYVEILPGNPGEEIPSRVAGQYKVVGDWNHGKELVDSASIETKKVNDVTGKYILSGSPVHGLAGKYESKQALEEAIAAIRVHDESCEEPETCEEEEHLKPLSQEEAKAILETYKAETATSYKYVAGIKLRSSLSTRQMDLIGSVKVIKKTNSNSASATTRDVNAVVGYQSVDAEGDMLEIDNDAPVVNFEAVDGEIELLFGNAASFLVSGKNQGKLYLEYSVKPNTDIIDQNENANIDFLSFVGKPHFNRNGDLRIFADKDAFLYEVTGSGLKKINAKYDEDYEAFVFETRTLGSYVISDSELKYTAESKPENGGSTGGSSGSGSSKPSKPSNPGTGASAVTGLAALAGAALAGLGIVSRKKSK